jgi:uncharacterized LabA/DUF88 family protein
MADEQNGANSKRPIAMLIDADNAQAAFAKDVLAEASKYGRITIRRIYGDWTTPNMNGWKDCLQDNAIQPIQQFRYTVGKNATDSAMIIDTMDILHSGAVNGFCLVTSDSDYTRLATRLRESGAFVMGIGRSSTPKAFTNACDLFVFIENLRPETDGSTETIEKKVAARARTPAQEALPLLQKAFELSAQDDGWAFLSSIGASLRSLDPSFDHRTFGFTSLRSLVANFSKSIELREEKKSAGNTILSIRFK